MNANFAAGSTKFWVGRHSADSDTLVFDPALAQSRSGNVTFFSLDHLRPRSFTPAAAETLINGVTDPKEVAAAKQSYQRWPELKAERDEAASQARSDAIEERRRVVSERHSAFLASLPGAGEGVVAKSTKRRRASTCAMCQRVLDNGTKLECDACAHRICTCGACGCGVPSRQSEVV